MSLGNVMKNATLAQDQDTAKVLAGVLNNDLLAITKLTGRTTFTPEDALRISRIMGEYEALGRSSTVSTFRSTVATGETQKAS